MKRERRPILLIFAVAALFFAVTLGANSAGQTAETLRVKTISLGLVSEIHQKEIEEYFRGFIGYIARKLSSTSEIQGRVVVAPTALQLAKLLEEKKVDFYMESPYPTYLINRQGAAVLLLRRWKGGMGEYRSLLFTKRDSGTTRLEDFRGKIIAFEDPGSTSGYFLPKVLLLRKGFKLSEKPSLQAKVAPKEVGYIFAHTDGNIVNMVLSNQVAAGAISNDDYAALDEKKRADIVVLAETETFPRHLVSVRKDFPPALTEQLKETLLAMNQNEEGRGILQKTDNTTKFDYLPGGEEAVRRKLIELFRPRPKR
jgi:phosphonate transport system substrate-binding protein